MLGNYLLFLWVATMSSKHKILFALKISFFKKLISRCCDGVAAAHSAWGIRLTLRDLFCFFFALVAIWLKLHIIGVAYSFIKSTVLQKNVLAYDFLWQLLPFPWKEIAPLTRWIFPSFPPILFLALPQRKMHFYIHFGKHYKFFMAYSIKVFHLVCLDWDSSLMSFPYLKKQHLV